MPPSMASSDEGDVTFPDGKVRKMKKELSFRCRGRSDRSEMHVIAVRGGRATCSCNGVDWCSHIDATLVAGERFMVPPEDRRTADAAQRRLEDVIRPPEGWQATWRDDRVWRGLSAPRSDERARMRIDGRPVICFVGAGPAGTKTDYEEAAETLGWRTVDRPTRYTTIVVASPGTHRTRAMIDAAKHGLEAIGHPDWDEWQYDFTNAVLDRIDELRLQDPDGFGA